MANASNKKLTKKAAPAPIEERLSKLERYLEEFFGEPLLSRFPLPHPNRLLSKFDENAWWPRVDVSETKAEIKVIADIPGVKTEDLNIETEDNRLIISGESKKEREEKGEEWFKTERETGSFYRAFDLPASADPSGITAELKDGTLTIRVPKRPGKPVTKKISVNKAQ